MDNTLSNVSSLPQPENEMKGEQGTPAQLLFFRQLHSMITDESSNDCVKWLSDRKGFAITDKEAFCSNALPSYFGKAKYSSFTRRLKRWGFRLITKGAHTGAYYHDVFHRDMDFEAYDDDLESDKSECCPSESSQLPLKKRMMWSQDTNNFEASNVSFVTCNRNVDIRVMPEIMREINRNKQRERCLPAAETSETKRLKIGYDTFANGGDSFNHFLKNHAYLSDKTRFGCEDHGLNSFRDSRSQELPQHHLARIKRQVLEQHGLFGLGYSQSEHSALGNTMNFFDPARRDLSQVATDILKREIELRRMQGLVGTKNSHQVHHAFVNRYEPNVSGAAASIEFRSYYTDPSRANKYSVGDIGASRGATSGRGISSICQESWNPFDAMGNTNDKRHYTPESFMIPIPGFDKIEQMKNPFNRAA